MSLITLEFVCFTIVGVQIGIKREKDECVDVVLPETHTSRASVCSPLASQLIQTISAVDTDEPLVEHKFVFSISANNQNFTVVDREGEKKKKKKITHYFWHS